MQTVDQALLKALDPRFGDRQKPLKIVVFPLSWVLAHVSRTVEIAKVLRTRGHEVVFAGADPRHPRSYLGHIEREGFRIVAAREPNWPWAWERFERLGKAVALFDLARHQRWAPLAENIEDIVRVVKAESPDLILGDASLGVTPAGHITGVPAACVFNAYNVKFYKPKSLIRGAVNLVEKYYWGPIRNAVYARHGVAPISGYELWRKSLVLSPDLPELFPPLPEFPNWLAVGPLVSDTSYPEPEWFDELDDGRTNIYISMGSTGFFEQFLDRVYPALAASPYRFIVTTGNQVSDACIARAPENFRFATYAPGSKLLERSSAFIFHGGNGSMYQALGAGVPMLALPCHDEQKIAGKKMREEGFGLTGNVRRISGKRLLRKIDELIENPCYRANAWRFRRAIRNANGAAQAADLLEAHARNEVQQAILNG